MTGPFHVCAVNTAADSENRIHNDQVAAEYGFREGLVPGVTVYGYMASAAIERLGIDWLHRGSMDVRFFQPFYDGEDVAISVTGEGRVKVDAGDRATASAWIADECLPDNYPSVERLQQVFASRDKMRPGVVLGTIRETLNLSQPGMSAPLDAWIGHERFAHQPLLDFRTKQLFLFFFRQRHSQIVAV